MEKELFFLLNPDSSEAVKPRITYRAPKPKTSTLPAPLKTYLRLRSAIKRKFFNYD